MLLRNCQSAYTTSLPAEHLKDGVEVVNPLWLYASMHRAVQLLSRWEELIRSPWHHEFAQELGHIFQILVLLLHV
jgi:hypothetical protein